MAKAENGKKEKPADTVRMRAPAGYGASGIPIGEEIIQIVPDKKGYVDAPPKCVNALRALGYQIIIHEATDPE